MTPETAKPTIPEKVSPSAQIEIVVSNILRWGVGLSLLIVSVGLVITFVRHPQYIAAGDDLARLTAHGASFPHDPRSLAASLAHGEGRGVIVCGLLLLIATPVLRVAVSILAFVYERDIAFIVITSIVLLLLLLSFVLGA